ncbi:hypothetical protein Hanom_Chr03g00196731 [Helianthus anomalus]
MQVKRGLTKSRPEHHRKPNAIAGGATLVFETPSLTRYIRAQNFQPSEIICFVLKSTTHEPYNKN